MRRQAPMRISYPRIGRPSGTRGHEVSASSVQLSMMSINMLQLAKGSPLDQGAFQIDLIP